MQEKISLSIIRKLQKSGHQAYWVGGCVRDILMGKSPKDYDIVTSARPEEIEKTLKSFNIIPVGKKFGVILAEKDGFNFEIATFRSESKYTDARRPDKVFWTSAYNDASRRDFTINGLYLDPLIKEKVEVWQLPGIRQMKTTNYGLVVDYVGGIKDLETKTIRFIGNPNERIKEDHLRLLRAVRFKITLDFNFNEETENSIKNNAELIDTVSKERVRDELNKIFSSPRRAQGLIELDSSGLLEFVLPEISKLKGIPQPIEYHKEGDVFMHTYLAIKSLPAESPITLVWAVLLHDTGKAETISYPKTKDDRIRFNKHVKYSAGIASEVCRRLKFPNFERELIVWLVKNHMIIGDIPKMRLSKQRLLLMDKRFLWLLNLHKADALGSWPEDLSLYKTDLSLYNTAKKLYDQEKKRPKYKPLVTGNDIIQNFNVKEGPEIGKILQTIKELQLEGKIKNKKEALNYLQKLSL
jgi:poly(A) polymerase